MLTYIRQAWLVLLLGLLFGVALAGVNTWLEPKIRANEREARERAAKEVFIPPDLTEAEKDAFLADVAAEETTVVVDGEERTVFKVTDADGDLLGWAAPAQGLGYADMIRLIVGLTPEDLKITDYRVIYSQETPGLGSMITAGSFRRQFRGKEVTTRLEAVPRAPTADDEIQALTGATISSQAVCDIIYQQVAESSVAAELRDKSRADAPASTTQR